MRRPIAADEETGTTLIAQQDIPASYLELLLNFEAVDFSEPAVEPEQSPICEILGG
jgi:hypothetical protein